MQWISETLRFFGMISTMGMIAIIAAVPAIIKDLRNLNRTRWKLGVFAEAVDMCALSDESFHAWLECATGMNEPYDKFYSVKGDGGTQSCSFWPQTWLMRKYKDEMKFRRQVYSYCLDRTQRIRDRISAASAL